jgi:voltage-dependent potassium channel beta subunit
MNYRNLGKHGIKLSEIGFGTWLTFGLGIDFDTAAKCIKAALDHEVNFFDSADVYALGEAERTLGKILFKEFEITRSDIVLATKCFGRMSDNPNDRGLSRKHIFESVEKSLRRLRTDYLDIYQCHSFDKDTPLQETCHAFDDLIHQGKILYWGFSNWSAQNIEDALKVCQNLNLYIPVSSQPVYNILSPEIEANGVLDVCDSNGIGQVTYSPLAQGILTGKYSGHKIPKNSRLASDKMNVFMKDRVTPDAIEKADKLKSIAGELGITLPQLAIAWCLRKKSVASVITGASTKKQVNENCKAIEVVISPDLEKRIKDTL